MPHVRDVHFESTLNFLKPREHRSRRGKPSSIPGSLQEWILWNSSRHPYPCRRIHSASVAVVHVERRSNDATRRASQAHRFPRLLSGVHLLSLGISLSSICWGHILCVLRSVLHLQGGFGSQCLLCRSAFCLQRLDGRLQSYHPTS